MNIRIKPRTFDSKRNQMQMARYWSSNGIIHLAFFWCSRGVAEKLMVSGGVI